MAKYYRLKVANMRKEQEFTLYPYNGGDTINLQSDKRFIQANLRTGQAIINNQNKSFASSLDLHFGGILFTLPEETKTEIQKFIWYNEGKPGTIGNVLKFENKELFSK